MVCDRCQEDKTATVVRSAAIARFPPFGRPTVEVRTSRLCVACGGGDAPEQLLAIGQRR